MQFLKDLQAFSLDMFGYSLGPAASLIIAVTAVLLAFFVFRFSIRASVLAQALKDATLALVEMRVSLEEPTDAALERIFSGTRLLARYWPEYRDRVHRNAASSAFASEIVIDDFLKVDVFRHFPVILVGVAVTGLILGLFLGVPEGDTAAPLVAGAMADGFGVTMTTSMAGLVLAIGVAVVEYTQVKQCRHWLRRMVQALDGLGDAPEEVGEEPEVVFVEDDGRASGVNTGLVAELNQLLAELGSEPATATGQANAIMAHLVRSNPTASGRTEIPEDVAREMRALLKEMRSGFTQSLLELAEANRAVRDQLVRLMGETEARQRRILEELERAADRVKDDAGTQSGQPEGLGVVER